MKWTRWALLILMPSIAGGCATATGDFCDVARPLRPSVQDTVTLETVAQVVAHNRYGREHCGWTP
ncbi:hypothetical protein [Stappia sp.]|uniref:hypothetical protein n=2 Tax=Stappia sp. TaxID=1870903 RepID=UPI0025FE9E16|nr:hypothetical protein [Stappia sp.]